MLKKFKQIVTGFFIGRDLYESREVELAGQLFLVRQLKSNDIKSLMDLERAVYHGELPWTKSAFLSEFHSAVPHLYIGVFQEETVIGFIGCRLIGVDTHITNVAVNPAMQGKGIGTFLIDEIEKFAIIRRCDTMSLEVRMSNKNAQRLYRKKGFVSKTIKPKYYTETQEDALEMVKFLKSE